MIKTLAIICDLDGTLCDSDHQVSSETLSAITFALDQGVVFTIATARPLGYLRYLLPDQLLNRIWKFCHNGAQLFTPSDSLIAHHNIDLSVQSELIADVFDQCDTISWYSQDKWLTDERFSVVTRTVHGISADYPAPMIWPVEELHREGVVNILVVGAKNSHRMISEYGERVSIYKSRSADLLYDFGRHIQ